MVPSVHLNGTSQNELFDQALRATRDLRTALASLKAAHPNGRDYYPQGTTAFSNALSEHSARLRQIETVLAEMETLAEAIQDGGFKR